MACMMHQQPVLVVGKFHTGKTVHVQAILQQQEQNATDPDDLSPPTPIEQINVCMLQQTTTDYVRGAVTR